MPKISIGIFSSFISFLVVASLSQSCKPKQQTETVEHIDTLSAQAPETTRTVETVQATENSQAAETSSSFVQYNGPVDDEIKKKLEAFLPLSEILSLSNRTVDIKDSIYTHHMNEQNATIPPRDTVFFNRLENKTYKAILAYRQIMIKGPSPKDACPSLLQLTRDAAPGDSSVGFLPRAGRSPFFSRGNFFFLGGAPFVGKIHPEDNATFTDPAGKPEVRFGTNLTENGKYFLNSIFHFQNLQTEVTFGPPLHSYYGWSRDIRGIGSLIHRFVKRVPVFLLTEEGLIPGTLMGVTIKLVPENRGCISDQPMIEFACAKSIDAVDILAVYIPYTSSTPTSCTVTRNGHRVWTADLNGDGIDDVACVSGSYLGVASGGVIDESLWFVNIDGQWRIIDAGENIDCT